MYGSLFFRIGVADYGMAIFRGIIPGITSRLE